MSIENFSHVSIKKSKSKKNPFKVSVIASNGETLVTSELLSTRKNCIKNIIATMKVFRGDQTYVQDHTGRKGLYEFTIDVFGKEFPCKK